MSDINRLTKVKLLGVIACVWLTCMSFPVLSKVLLDNSGKALQNDQLIWHRVNIPFDSLSYTALQEAFEDSPESMMTLLGQRGDFVAKLPIENQSNIDHWFLVLNANFIDKGIGFWHVNDSDIVPLTEFSQMQNSGAPILQHYQAIPLPLKAKQSGELWLFVSAKHFAYPLSLEFLIDSHFYQKQFTLNTITIAAIAIMLILAIIACILYLRTGYLLSLACAGYIGLHAVGWAAASGLIDDIVSIEMFNTSYGGMLLFPFAISCAAYFTRLLFNSDIVAPRIARVLQIFTWGALLVGLINPWLGFHQSFLLSHVLAIVWVPLTVFIGIYMLGESDFRARYYLLGNAIYAASLVFYMVSHVIYENEGFYPELVVLGALSFDCLCILLSMSEWLKNKQTEYFRSYAQARLDQLTQIGNRYAFNEAIKEIHHETVIVFIDLDGMKKVNDERGHEEGDRLLSESAMLMRQLLDEKGQVFRAGGDEFIWLIDRFAFDTLKSCTEYVDDLTSKIEVTLHEYGWQVGVSHGMASTAEAPTVSACLALADQRMYEDKRKNKPSYRI